LALKTTLEQLEEVQTAISNVMLGQDVTIEGKRLTLADLAALERREEKLLARYRAEAGTGGPAFNTAMPKGRET
jgi:hypothetical protein